MCYIRYAKSDRLRTKSKSTSTSKCFESFKEIANEHLDTITKVVTRTGESDFKVHTGNLDSYRSIGLTNEFNKRIESA